MALRRLAFRWEVASLPFVFVAGSLLHFTYDWFDRSPWIAPFAAIDESVWEHLKLAFWPAVAFSVLEAVVFGSHVRNFVLAKAVGLSVAPLTIVLGYYGYTSVLGFHTLAADLGLFGIAVTLGAAASLAVFAVGDFAVRGRIVGFAVIVAWIAAFASFTFQKPPLGLFHSEQDASEHG